MITGGQLAQALYLLSYLAIFVACVPAAMRILTVRKPPRHFDPIKMSFAFMALAFINSFVVRLGVNATLWDSNDLVWILASGIATVTFLGAVALTFLMERVVFRDREP